MAVGQRPTAEVVFKRGPLSQIRVGTAAFKTFSMRIRCHPLIEAPLYVPGTP